MESSLPKQHYDCVIVGGGINGTAIAADAASRGLSVLLCEQNDLGSGTSSWSTKLIHGGLRYLESYEFKLVRHALIERSSLIKRASFIVKPMPFIIPHQPHLRPKWMIRAGLFIYDHLTKRGSMPRSKGFPIDHHHPQQALQPRFRYGFRYTDCQTDDNRLVILNALSAEQQGADILTHCSMQQAQPINGQWSVTLLDAQQQQHTVSATAVINAAGPWVNALLDHRVSLPTTDRVTLIQGSHIVVKQLYPQQHAYLLQNKDGRVIFTIPYEYNFTLIGTTDTAYSGEPANATISDQEIDYLLATTNTYFKRSINKNDIVWQYSGVRALYNPDHADPSKITREYHLASEDVDGAALISILGGKLTTHRQLAEDTVDLLQTHFPHMTPCQTQNTLLPGGDLNDRTLSEYHQHCQSQFPWLKPQLLTQYLQRYGSRIEQLLSGCQTENDLGTCFSTQLYAREIDFLIQTEWAQSADDILWRRSKHGLHMTTEQQHAAAQYINTRRQSS